MYKWRQEELTEVDLAESTSYDLTYGFYIWETRLSPILSHCGLRTICGALSRKQIPTRLVKMAEKPYPVQKSTTSFWRTNLHPLDSHRSTETLPTSADIVIIGAGYAGASVVHHLLEHESFSKRKPFVVILEAREACSGATGRNGGHLKPGTNDILYYLTYSVMTLVCSRSIHT